MLQMKLPQTGEFKFLVHALHKYLVRKKSLLLSNELIKKCEPALDCRHGCSLRLQEVPFFSSETVENEIRARKNGHPMRGR